MKTEYLQVNKLTKSYPLYNSKNKKKIILDNISFNIKKGEFIAIFGPNGCGKTTLLKIISGIESMDKGSIIIDCKNPNKKKIGFIFQNYSDSLMPWLNCLNNILFPYDFENNNNKTKAKKKLIETLSNLKINLPLDNYPYQLSGGQQQLVSILRAINYKPDIILMDEPFSSLDHTTHKYMQKILLNLWQKEKLTILFITHDIEEALLLADKIILISSSGKLLSIEEVPFNKPREHLLNNEVFLNFKKKILNRSY